MKKDGKVAIRQYEKAREALEFGFDCGTGLECRECDESTFAACAAKQDELKKEIEALEGRK